MILSSTKTKREEVEGEDEDTPITHHLSKQYIYHRKLEDIISLKDELTDSDNEPLLNNEVDTDPKQDIKTKTVLFQNVAEINCPSLSVLAILSSSQLAECTSINNPMTESNKQEASYTSIIWGIFLVITIIAM